MDEQNDQDGGDRTSRLNNGSESDVAPSTTHQGKETAQDRVALAIAGIGASAGGLQPLGEFLDAMPPDSGLAFVVIQHLSPQSLSMLPELLGRHTAMEVRQAEEGALLAPNTVHVIGPGQDLWIEDNVLHVQDRDGPEDLHLPIDIFFRALAQDRGQGAIGIVLSGAGADGALGLRAIKERGGLAIVQSLDTAEHASMPRNALETGLVDYVVKPGDMPPLLLTYAAYLRDERQMTRRLGEDVDQNALKRILAILAARTGHNFALYKQSTVLRRIQRRMMLQQIEGLDEYGRFVNHSADEVQALLQEMLISVTEFFRDPEAFEALEKEVLPGLLDGRQTVEPLRVWVPACATGEEAYSIAILIREYLEEHAASVGVQIFATDIDEEAIDRARRGIYPLSISACVSSERLQRFFTQKDDVYQVDEAVRKMVVFAPQSIAKDPPFSRLDLVSCRNLLIYLEPALQQVVLSALAYALKPGGYLFLGSSETPAQLGSYFEAVNPKWRIYQRLEGQVQPSPLTEFPERRLASGGQVFLPPVPRQNATRQVVEHVLLENHMPPSLVVNQEGEILFVYGRTGRYLEPLPGETGSWQVARMLRQGLRMPLMTAIRRAATTSEVVEEDGLRFDLEGQNEQVNVSIQPLDPLVSIKGLFLVTFWEPRPALPPEEGPPSEAEHGPSEREAKLERELQATREYLQATIEELQSSNEEIQSTNEELQSANEELQTAQEEALSVNEELSTLNTQLETKVGELQSANDDMKNLLASIDVGIIFLDRQFRIRRFNESAKKVANLLAGDVGRPIEHIASNLGNTDWLAKARNVFEHLVPFQEEVQTREGQWFWMRIQPYRTVEDAIDGVVLTFTEITQQKDVEQALRQAREFAAEVVNTVRQPLVVLDGALRVQEANRAFYERFHLDAATTEGHLLYDLGDRQWDIPRLRNLLEEVIPNNTVVDGFEVEHDFREVGRLHMVLHARRLIGSDGRPDLILLAIEERE